MISRHVGGWIPDRPDHRDLIFRLDARASSPDVVDNIDLCPRVEDQGNLGSCVGCAWTSGGEFLGKRLGLVARNFSRLQAYLNARKLGGFPVDSDTGAYVRDGAKAAVKFGFCPESLWPYDVLKFAIEPPLEAREAALRHQVTAYSRCLTLATIRQAIADRYPVVGGFAVPETVLSEECERTGRIKFPGPSDSIIGGHAVLFIGYDNNKRLLKFQNSWGESWGQAGYGYLPYRFVWSRLATDFWTIHGREGRSAASKFWS